MAPFEVLYGCRCRLLVDWFELGEAKLLGLDLVIDAMEKAQIICDQIKVVYDWQKSYIDKWKQQLEFQERDRIFLKVSLMKGVMWFNKKGKLALRYISPFFITKCIKEVAY